MGLYLQEHLCLDYLVHLFHTDSWDSLAYPIGESAEENVLQLPYVCPHCSYIRNLTTPLPWNKPWREGHPCSGLCNKAFYFSFYSCAARRCSIIPTGSSTEATTRSSPRSVKASVFSKLALCHQAGLVCVSGCVHVFLLKNVSDVFLFFFVGVCD